jgi:hypothetical protein
MNEGTEAHAPIVVHDMLLLGPEQQVDPVILADLDFAAQIQRHHEGGCQGISRRALMLAGPTAEV